MTTRVNTNQENNFALNKLLFLIFTNAKMYGST